MASTLIREVTIGGTTQVACIGLPRKWARNGSKPPVIMICGTGDLVDFGVRPDLAQPTFQRIVDAGFPVAMFAASLTYGATVNTWGNDYCQTWISTMISLMQSEYGAKSGKAILVGLSQGSLCVLSHAGRYPSSVAAVHTILPSTSLAVAAAEPSVSAQVKTAYNTYSESTHGPTHSPIVMAQATQNPYTMPINLVWAAQTNGTTTSDGVIVYARIQEFYDTIQSKGGQATLVFTGNTGHSWAAANTTPAYDALMSLLANY